MKFLTTLARFFEQVNVWVGQKTAWLTGILVVLFTYDVVMRYLFNFSKVWTTELEWHLFSLIFLLGAAYTFQEDRHVRVDVFYQKFSPRKKAWVNLAGTLFLLIPWCLIIIFMSFDFAYKSMLQGEGSPNPGGLPYRFVIKFAIVAGFILLLLQAIAGLIQAILTISGHHSSNQNSDSWNTSPSSFS
jgi:TRAP-type mannitol/chloroaromatic compound transport system permease small subunit